MGSDGAEEARVVGGGAASGEGSSTPYGAQEALTPKQSTEEEPFNNHDDDDDDDDEEEEEEDDIQLGFAEEVVRDEEGRMVLERSNWRDWDGGKIGGKPIWLDPEELPTTEALSCPSCQDPLSFLLQIYCPLDEPADAFHRALYVYCCRRPACTGRGCAKVLRCQLPRRNPFHAYDPDKEVVQVKAEKTGPKLCRLCGLKADKLCSGCLEVSYCSRAHQKEHWKAGHKRQCRGASEAKAGEKLKPVRSVFPEYEIVIEEERGGSDDEKELLRKREDEELVRKYKDVVVDETDEDATLGQKDLNEASGAKNVIRDKHTLKFLTRIREHPSQVLRYARWAPKAPLWVSSEGQPQPTDIPPCPHCKMPRAFEFQVMSQMLQYLRVDAAAILPSKPGEVCKVGSLDWGTLAVYTCTKSCSAYQAGEKGCSYVEEFLWRQQPLV